MSRAKRILREVFIIATMAVVGYATIMGVLAYKDWQGCVCSVLSSTEQTFPIDERLHRVCGAETLQTGTFMIVRTQCSHSAKMLLRIMPDECQYTGKLI